MYVYMYIYIYMVSYSTYIYMILYRYYTAFLLVFFGSVPNSWLGPCASCIITSSTSAQVGMQNLPARHVELLQRC